MYAVYGHTKCLQYVFSYKGSARYSLFNGLFYIYKTLHKLWVLFNMQPFEIYDKLWDFETKKCLHYLKLLNPKRVCDRFTDLQNKL